MRRKNETSDTMMDYITEALLLLMREHPYEDITIAELTKKAGVDRTTYYRHFHSKESILERYLDRILQEFIDRYHAEGDPGFDTYLLRIFETFYAYRENLLLIDRAGYAWLLLPLITKRFHFESYQRAASVRQQYAVSYIIGGIYNKLLLWFRRGMKETPAEMQAIARTIRPEGALTMLDAGERMPKDL